MKKIMTMILAFAFICTLFASCGKNENGQQGKKKYQVGIVQIVEHSSLNTIRETMLEELKNLGLDERNLIIKMRVMNRQI